MERRPPSDAGRAGVQNGGRSGFSGLIRSASREEIGFDVERRHERGQHDIHAGQEAARLGPVDAIGTNADAEAGEGVEAPAIAAPRRTDGIERAACVEPVGVANQPLIAKHQLLSSGAHAEAGWCRASNVDVGESRVDDVLKRRPPHRLLVEEHARVLKLNHNPPRLLRLQHDPEPEPVQRVGIVVPRLKACALHAFQANAVLGARLQP